MLEFLFVGLGDMHARPAYYGEHPVDYLKGSSLPESVEVKNFLNNAFEHYPDEEKENLRKRIFNVDVARTARPAITELIIHEKLLMMGYDVEVEPALENNKRPDFLATSKNSKCYLEVITKYENLKEDDHKNKKFIDELMQELNSEFSNVGDATLWFSVINYPRGVIGQQAKKKRNSLIKDELKQLCCNRDSAKCNGDADKCNRDPIKWMCENSGACVEFQVRGVCVEFQVRNNVGVSKNFVSCIYDQKMLEIDVCEAVRKAFKKKGSKYGVLDAPLVLVVNLISDWTDIRFEIEALFGREYCLIGKGGPQLRRRADGVWSNVHGKQYANVSAIWIFDKLTEWRLNCENRIYLNPFARLPLNREFYMAHPYAEVSGSGEILIENSEKEHPVRL